ncbi:hypothetical protein ScPMuIL_015435 [Solemya velum]
MCIIRIQKKPASIRQKNMAQIFRSLPRPWFGLFEALNDNNDPVGAANIWYQKNVMSKTRTRIDWCSLLHSLSIEKPVDSEGMLQFTPQFLLLPESFQKNCLTFILHHRGDVEPDLLKDFTGALLPKGTPDSWPSVLLRILFCYVQGIGGSSTYAFSTESGERLASLYQKLETESALYCPLWNRPQAQSHHITNQVDDAKTGDSLETDVMLGAVSMEIDSQPDCIVLDGDDKIMLSQTQTCEVSISVNKDPGDSEEMESPELQDNHPLLDASTLERVEDLQRCWCNSSMTSCDPPSSISVLTSVTPHQMSVICQQLGMHMFTDVAMATACRHLSTLSDIISFANCSVILEQLFLYKLQNLSDSASRLFTTAMLEMAEEFPKQLIDVVLVPCTGGSLGQSQMEILCRVLNEVLLPENRTYFLRKTLVNPGPINDSMLALFQVIISSKIDVNGEILEQYLTLLEKVSQEMQNSQKYGKLVLLSVQRYGKQMSHGQLCILESIAACHQTFLKKSIKATVTRLQK